MLLACVALTLCLTACARRLDLEADRRDVQQVFETYLKSVNAADPEVGGMVWMRSPDVVAVTPLGRYQGWDSVRKDLYVDFLQKMFTARDLRASNIQIHVTGDSAWLVFDWAFTGTMANGQMMMSKGRESHVYERTDNGWRISHLHYSGVQPPPS